MYHFELFEILRSALYPHISVYVEVCANKKNEATNEKKRGREESVDMLLIDRKDKRKYIIEILSNDTFNSFIYHVEKTEKYASQMSIDDAFVIHFIGVWKIPKTHEIPDSNSVTSMIVYVELFRIYLLILSFQVEGN